VWSLRSTTRLARHTGILTSRLEPDVSTISDPFAQSVRIPPTVPPQPTLALARETVPTSGQTRPHSVAVLTRDLEWVVGVCSAALVLVNMLASPMHVPPGIPTGISR